MRPVGLERWCIFFWPAPTFPERNRHWQWSTISMADMLESSLSSRSSQIARISAHCWPFDSHVCLCVCVCVCVSAGWPAVLSLAVDNFGFGLERWWWCWTFSGSRPSQFERWPRQLGRQPAVIYISCINRVWACVVRAASNRGKNDDTCLTDRARGNHLNLGIWSTRFCLSTDDHTPLEQAIPLRSLHLWASFHFNSESFQSRSKSDRSTSLWKIF